MKRITQWLATACLFAGVALSTHAADKKIVLVAGRPSHGPLEHEFNAGCLLLQKKLKDTPGIKVEVVLSGWPKDESVFNDAAAIFIYADGGGAHPAIQGDNLKTLDALMSKGIGLGCAHYGVEVPKDKGGAEFLKWIGGYFETHWSVNPSWQAEFKQLPAHPVMRGVKPFGIFDEWYFNMRFAPGMKGVTPLLSAVPPASTMDRPDGQHSGNPDARKMVAAGLPQHMMWAYERPDGTRGFGFTGGHQHLNWKQDDFRKAVLNAILWSAKVEVPANGVASTITDDELMENLDPKEGQKPRPAPTAKP